MADVFQVHIDKLGVDNYINWSRKIKFLLQSKDLWDGVTNPGEHASQSTKALSIIGLNVEDHHLGTMRRARPQRRLGMSLRRPTRASPMQGRCSSGKSCIPSR